jgi:hypothetical protein
VSPYASAFDAPGTSGDIASIFSDKARLMIHQREKEEREAAEKSAKRWDTAMMIGDHGMKQAGRSQTARTLQQEQLSLMQEQRRGAQHDMRQADWDLKQGTIGKDQYKSLTGEYQGILDKTEGVQNIKASEDPGFFKGMFKKQGVEYIDPNTASNLSPAAESLGLNASPALQDAIVKPSGPSASVTAASNVSDAAGTVSAGNISGAAGAVDAGKASGGVLDKMNSMASSPMGRAASGSLGALSMYSGIKSISEGDVGFGNVSQVIGGGTAMASAAGLGAGTALGAALGPVGWAAMGVGALASLFE